MRRAVVVALQALVLVATGAALVATSCRRRCERKQPAQQVTFDVGEGCGPPGELGLAVGPNGCELTVFGAEALRLPAEGEHWGDYPLEDGGWELTDVVTHPCEPTCPSNASTSASADGGRVWQERRSCVAAEALGRGWPLELRCSSSPTNRGACVAPLTIH